MGNFHSDFPDDVLYAQKSIFLTKKVYCHELLKEDGTLGYHIRAKGIPTKCIENYCDEHNITPIEFYQRLEHESIVIDLTNGRVCLKKQKNGRFLTLEAFERKIDVSNIKQTLNNEDVKM